MTLITESAASLHLDGHAERALRQTVGYSGRYDLLALPSLEAAMGFFDHADIVRSDLKAAVGLHQVERAFVLTDNKPFRDVIEKIDSRVYGTNLRFAGYTDHVSAAYGDGESLVVTCMDWRLHGPGGGLTNAIKKKFGLDRFDLMAFAGAAKEVASGTRRSFLMNQIDAALQRGLKRIILLSHTDCGKYGGRGAFRNADVEYRALGTDLQVTCEMLRTDFPSLALDAGILETGADSVSQLVHLFSRNQASANKYSRR